MTDNEIINNIIWCMNPNNACADCPYYELRQSLDCVSSLFGDTVDLINRQKAEIERLRDTLKIYHNYNPAIKRAKAEAVKEFAERLIQSLIGMPQKDLNYSNLIEHIDNLYKKTVGDSNDK